MNGWLERIRAALARLSPRERMLTLTAAGAVALLLVWLLVVSPVLSLADRVGSRVAQAEQQLRVMQRLKHDYEEVHRRLADVEQRIQSGPRGNLRTTLESLARQAAVKVESMEPQASPSHTAYRETKVEVGLRDVTLAQTVNYLHQIERAPQVLSIKTLRMRAQQSASDLLDVTFTVSSFEPL